MHSTEQRVHVIRAENAHLYEREFDQYHRLRADIFVREMGWRDLRVVDGRERDQFDTAETVHFLAIEPELGVVGGCRLHPSLGPTLLADVFPGLADVRGFERALDVAEWTRLFVVPARREERPCRTAGALKCAVLEYCLDEGVRAINGVAETWFLPNLIKLGWRPRALGETLDRDGFSLFAFCSPVTEEALATTRAYYDLEQRTSLRRRLPEPVAALLRGRLHAEARVA